ncbi:MAG: response regulator transcription factor [Armatimonadota bacterium]
MKPDKALPSHLIEVLLVDDHPAVRQGLGLLLTSEGFIICGEASGRFEALDCISNSKPDLALVDLSLGGEDGITVIEEMRKLNIPTLVYSMHDDAQHVAGAFNAGALGYVTKREQHGVLFQAIRDVARGRRFVSPNAAISMTDLIMHSQSSNSERELSDQEAQVYRLIGEGEGTIEIAGAMHISTRTVESYYTRIMEKLGISGMQSLRRHAINHLRDPKS